MIASGAASASGVTRAPVDPYDPDSCAVYRFWNPARALLYVGIAGEPRSRFKSHRDGSWMWWHDWSDRTVEWFASREQARAEELRAIAVELPAHNVADVPEQAPWPASSVVGWWWREQIERHGIDLVTLDRLGDDQLRVSSLDPVTATTLPADPELVADVYRVAYAAAGRRVRRQHHDSIARRDVTHYDACRRRSQRWERETAAVMAAL